jgi:hypothetical protein
MMVRMIRLDPLGEARFQAGDQVLSPSNLIMVLGAGIVDSLGECHSFHPLCWTRVFGIPTERSVECGMVRARSEKEFFIDNLLVRIHFII